jgi:hypothetical protein
MADNRVRQSSRGAKSPRLPTSATDCGFPRAKLCNSEVVQKRPLPLGQSFTNSVLVKFDAQNELCAEGEATSVDMEEH